MKYSRIIFFWALVVSITAQAAPYECIKGSVVLRNKYRDNQATEVKAISELLTVKSHNARTVSGVTEIKRNGASARAICTEEENPCFKLKRKARGTGYSHVIRLAHSYCSPNYVLYAAGTIRTSSYPVNDTYYAKEKSDMDAISLPRAWTENLGSSNVVVAIIDTGVDYTHPDLPNVLSDLGRDFSTDENELPDPMDDNGHGTHVAGTIGAMGNNGIGVAGIAWNVKILPLKFLDSSGSGTLAGAVRAIDYMVQQKSAGLNIVVANNSWGGGGYSDTLAAAIRSANDAGIVFTAAAGNEANNNDHYPSYPANYNIPNVVSVAAIDSSDLSLAYFSNYGSRTVDIAAPGVDIASTYIDGQYALLSGTSMATPHVTGAIALLSSDNSTLTTRSLINRLYATAKYTPSLVGSVRKARLLNVRNMLLNKVPVPKGTTRK